MTGDTPESQNVNQSEHQISEPEEHGDHTRRLTLTQAILLAVMILILLGFSVFLHYTRPEPNIIKKETLKATIIKAIENGADLRAVKQIYFNRAQFISWGFSTATTHYPISAPLSVILEDIRTDLFINRDTDKSLIPLVDGLITQHFQTNPFDNLEPTQKDNFERLREKIGDRYTAVQAEVTKIADELYAQNLLTKQYLRDSTISFWVSIAGLTFAFIIGGIQIYQGRRAHPRS
jgi:hypothetical protein